MSDEVRKKRFPGLPLFCDPSHICGKRGLLYGICAEALRLDMDGLFIESHCCPEVALSDAAHLTSSLRTPKFFVKEFSYFLMPCHQHGLRINLLVQR